MTGGTGTAVAPSTPADTSIAGWIRLASRRLARGGANGKLYFGHGALNAADEAAWIAAHACRLSPLRLGAHLERPMRPVERRRADVIAAERIDSRKPLAYLLGEAWLSGLRFAVDERVIVPRSFISELLPDELSPWIGSSGAVKSALDLCTGSGCLAILAARAWPRAKVDAIDLSPEALAVARDNIRRHRLEGRVRALQSDLFAGVDGVRPKRYQVMLSNPPYVDTAAMHALPAEYRREPRLALAGGRDGLHLVKKILRGAARHLAHDGVLVMEIGHNRRALERAFPRTPFMWMDTSAGPDMVFLLAAADLPHAAGT